MNEVWTGKGPGFECTLHGPKFASAQQMSVAVKNEFIFSGSISFGQRDIYEDLHLDSVLFDMVCSNSKLA